MRVRIAVSALLVTLTACSFSGASGQPGADADGNPPPDGHGDLDGGMIDASPMIDAPPAIPTVPMLRTPHRNAYLGSVRVPASLRPTFTWAPSTTTGNATITYQLELSTDATFATGVTTASTTATSYTPATPLAVSSTAPVGARYFWRVKACVATDACSASSMTWWLNLGRSERDLNGDGFADVVVGAPGNDAAGADAGRAYVYFGAAGGTFNATPDGTLTGAGAGDQFGTSVATAGDVNGDGFADVIVGARYNGAGGMNAGRAYVYFGAAGATFDANADGTLTGAAAFDNFGISVASAGDVNNDGFFDVIVGAPGNDAGGDNAGRAYVYFGAAGDTFDATADGTLTGAAASDYFGTSVATAGDVNGDGFADLLVGAYLNSAGGMNAGRAYVYFGAASFDAVADGTLTGAAAGDVFGYAVASAGDLNSDGFADVVIGAYFNDAGGTDAGRAYVYFGAAGDTFDATADGTLTGAAANDVFGTSVAGAGDLNGDGFADLIVGSHGSSAGGTFAGRAYVYFGATGDTFDATADGTLTGAAANDFFGISVAAAGDVNGDGFTDVIVGAQLNDAGGTDAGRAYLYFGATGATFDATADGTLTGASARDLFGVSVAFLGTREAHRGRGAPGAARPRGALARRAAAPSRTHR